MQNFHIYKEGKANLKYILIVVILAVIIGGGILAYQYWWLPKEEAKMVEIKIQKEMSPGEMITPEIEEPEKEAIIPEPPTNILVDYDILCDNQGFIYLRMKLEWTNPTGADIKDIRVYRSTERGKLGMYKNQMALPYSTYNDYEVDSGIVYYYTLRSISKSGDESKNTDQYKGYIPDETTAGWNTYRDSESGFSIKYPTDWECTTGVSLRGEIGDSEDRFYRFAGIDIHTY